MKKLFSVAVDGIATSQQRDAFTRALMANKAIGFWHHLSPFLADHRSDRDSHCRDTQQSDQFPYADCAAYDH